MAVNKLGRFEIIREIGKGAMGVVYLAHDPKIDRKIAIKMVSIPAGLSADEARESRRRFVREAQAAGKLQHPNIITIYDVVEEEGLSYIAMEYVDGETLEAYARPGKLLPLPKVLATIVQACNALDFAHRSNVIHRDIKPANLMLVKRELLKITDFGLAKNPDGNLTQAGVLIGTPNYMSPEQISGKPMDGRSDFFSLGVVLYEMLTGERPFGGDTISTIIYRILYEEPPSPRILNEKLPVAFDRIFRRALAKDPALRFQTGAEFVDALNNYSTAHLKIPVSAAPPTLRAARGEAVLPRPPVRARSAPYTPLLAGQPLKVAALAFFTVLAVLFFPRRIHEGGGRGSRPGETAVAPHSTPDEAGFGNPVKALGKMPELPKPTGHQTTVNTEPGATIFLDNQLLNEPLVKLPESDQGEHTLLAVKGCNEKSILIEGSRLGQRTDLLPLEPKVADLTIDSQPPGALVYLDDKLLGPTPVTVPDFKACEPATFILHKESFSEFRRHFDGTSTWSEITGALGSVTLSEIPPGYVKIGTPPSYAVEVFEGQRLVPLKDGTLTLPEGAHTLTIKSRKVFLNLTIKADVTASKTKSQKIDWPELGSLSVQAEPSRCKIFVDGELLDYPPITEVPIVAGEHVIKAVPDADPGRAQEKRVTVQPGSTYLQTFTIAF